MFMMWFASLLQFHSLFFSLFPIVYCNYVDTSFTDDKLNTTIEVMNYEPYLLPYGENITIICRTKWMSRLMWWTVNDRNVSDEGYKLEHEGENINIETEKKEVSILHILNINLSHVGSYVCHVTNKEENDIDIYTIVLNVTLPAQVIKISEPVFTKMHRKIELHCLVSGYPIESIKWYRDNEVLSNLWHTVQLNETLSNSTLTIQDTMKKDNGTYICSAVGSYNIANSSTALLVLDVPHVGIDFIKPIGVNKIYFNWTINDGNSPQDLLYHIQYRSTDNTDWIFYPEQIEGSKRSYVLTNSFRNDTEYKIRIQAENSEGESGWAESDAVQMLSEDPIFIPEVQIPGATTHSIAIKWSEPPDNIKDHVHYYTLYLKAENSSVPHEAVSSASNGNLYMFEDLEPASAYYLKVAACSNYSKTCGPWSEVVNRTTIDGISGPPSEASIDCRNDNITQTSYIHVTWKPPTSPHGKIMSYNVNLEGSAQFINERGILEHITWGPKSSSVGENTLHARFYNVSANTNYTVRISAVTRKKRSGQAKELHCMMRPTIPDKQKLSGLHWRKMEDEGKWMFKLKIPRVSERNGPICCYRIYLVRMESQQKLAELPSPQYLPIMSYSEAHRTAKGGAYVAEMFTSASFHPEVFLGDDQVFNELHSQCEICIGLRPYTTTTADANDIDSNATESNSVRNKRQMETDNPLPPNDGSLDVNSNYTGFVEIMVHGGNGSQYLAAYSNYFVMMTPGPEFNAEPVSLPLGITVHLLCASVALILLLFGVICILNRYTKQGHAQAVEMITFRTSLRSLRGRQRLVSLNPPDMCPISNEDLLSSYMERHRDSDYGFQQEFELLPDRFSDRTTRASDTRENIYKNRYPDIKSYDQTRVKLSQIDGITSSEYINANYVVGYKERKKYICAQGPMDTTVNDFWRMIWEQHLELILMLTNLEEYSKTKCAKYWPDCNEGDKIFGDFCVSHVQEKRYSDYIVRELKVTKINGRKDQVERKILQYHYLIWKDFMAPEHPNGIIKFIKRINEAYSLDKGSILVHCSAGVGRTGTLVALDCLLQQLREEGHVSIFNTICELRHQRNFLVQSLKQYIFIYRALLEVAQYGDTEIPAAGLKTTIDKLKTCEKDKNKCILEEEFENVLGALEDKKSYSVANAEENREKNRSETVIPYDRNRVILTPLSGREHSTYINASFIEGYDNTESFIITQDPTELTINDFWRMIAEQNISVIVMLSEIGEGKCPRYWPEDESTYEHITVRYIQAESCPYYTHREMFIRSRDGEEHKVTHLQYHGWPTVDGEVPEVTRGMIEVVDQSQASLVQNSCSPSMVVHCNLGADRSSMFVGLSILVQQLRTEKRVDVFTLTRKLRSQRQGLISSYVQYEFLHRAIVNYAELHGLCDA